MNLQGITKPEDFVKLQGLFSFDLSRIEVRFLDRDGPGNVGGWVTNSVWRPTSVVYFDRADIWLNQGLLDLSHPVVRNVTIHELVHLEQARRGFWWRIKMRLWNRFKKYEDRPHEIEARERAAVYSRDWELQES